MNLESNYSEDLISSVLITGSSGLSNSRTTKPYYFLIAVFCVLYSFLLTLYPFYLISYTLILLCVVLLLSDIRLGVFYLIFAFPILKRILTFVLGNEPPYLDFYFYLLGLFILIYQNIFFQKKIRIIITKIDKLILIFLIYIIISLVLVTSNREYGFEKFQYLILSVILFYLPKLLLNNQIEILVILKAIFFFGITLVVYGFLQLKDFIGIDTIHYSGRFSIMGWNPIWIARYLSYAVLIEIFLLIKFWSLENIGKVTIIVVIMLFQTYLIILTGSRGPLLGLIIGSFTFLITQVKLNIKKIILFSLIILIILGTLGLIIPQESNNRITSNNDQGKLTAAIRLLANLHAIKLFLSNSIFGIGFGSFSFGGEFIETLHYPHNIFTELLAETGIIGFMLFVIIMLSILLKYLKEAKGKHEIPVSIIFSLFIAALINANLSGHIGGNSYLWLFLGLMHYASYSITNKTSADK